MGVLGFTDYPGLDPLEQGEQPNRGYGELQGIRCHAIEAGAAVTLASDMSADDTTLTVVDSGRLPVVGENPFALQAGQEQLWVTSIVGNTLTVERGYGGGEMPSVHPEGLRLYEVCSRYVYLLAAHPVKSVGSIYIDGRRQSQEGYIAYTGQSGDELAGYEGKAVVVFSAEAYAGKQFNLDFGSMAGIEVTAAGIAWSSPEVADGMSGTFALAGGQSAAGPTAWAGFGPAYGTVLGQTYSADIQNAGAASVGVRLVVRREGALISSREFTILPSTRETLSIWRSAGEENDELVVTPMGGQVQVYGITKSLTMVSAAEAELTIEMLPTGPTSGRSRALSVTGLMRHHAHYSASDLGQVRAERHEVSVTESSGISPACLRLAAGELGYKEVTIAAGATETVRLNIEGGAWSTHTSVGALRGEFSLGQLKKSVTYYPDSAGTAHESAETCSARLVVGGEVRADAGMAIDSDASYGGLGTLIERPDHVMRHFLISFMGFSSVDIDASAFSAAGAAFGSAISGGYKFSFLVNHALPMSRTLRRMAAESRSAISFSQGKWRLNYLPDTAPSAIKIITAEELAGKGAMFAFERAPLVDMANTLALRYGPQQAGGSWLGEYEAADAASVAKYGVYKKEADLMLVWHKETAQSVAEHMLKQSAAPQMSVKFTVFYEHFDLGVGDTIEIENELYSGSRFYIERIHRLDRFRAEVEALGWWG